MATERPERARNARWRAAAELLELVRRQPGITRADAARRLNVSSGTATEISARLRNLRLLTESPAPAAGRGRPTTVLHPHARGPLVLAAELRHEDWRVAVVTLDGRLHDVQSGRHRSQDPQSVLTDLREALDQARSRYPERLRAVSLAVAGTVRNDELVQASTLGWGAVDLSGLTAGTGLDFLLGNDATLAGVAETRTGAAAGAKTALHLTVEVGIGGALLLDGHPLTGAGGAGGEYGHVPFGNPASQCPCGARGCWDLEVDGRALARHLGEEPPADPRRYARQVLDRAPHEPRAARAVAATVTALAAGIAGLANAHAPEVITLGGLAVPLRIAAPTEFDAAFRGGLMTFLRAQPPPVLDAVHGDDGALHGAAAVGLDHITSESALADWAEKSPEPAAT
ncbi:ROK family transcriptional regulator [Pengzhenrongella sicca]|uniref:ROK family transcriptional regulator n=1 Tax=Pengzhenrongella sicca TaxID=2819238 RepID=A0A8A4ZB16_9MICO|nr:ROK family transcriptional regulator [Pengzhenrongella sicca]QTE28073.1 ROK family transcriptional regulator [Pengzhenrongella sicca]